MKLKKLDLNFRLTDGQELNFKAVNKLDGRIENDLYFLDVEKKKGIYWISLKRKNGKSFELDSVEYDVHLPLLNYGKVIVPDSGRFYMDTFFPRQVWNRQFELVGRSFGNPFFALLDSLERGVFAVGLMGDMMETCFHFYSPGANRKNSLTVQGGCLKFKISKPIGKGLRIGKVKEFRDGLFTIDNFLTWFDALREYGNVYRESRRLQFDSVANWGSLSPALCTWRVINSDSMTHDWIVKTAGEAKKLGIGSIIFDDGWYGVGLDGLASYCDMGDWPRTIKGKFKDIEKTVKEVQSLGVKAILWYCPISIGPDSKILKQVEDLLCWTENEKTGEPELYKVAAGFHTLCPRNPKARQIMFDHLKRLIVDYGADGIKIDLFDYMPAVPCVADHEHDLPTTTEGVKMFFREAFKLSQKFKPGSLFSVKNNYGNIEISPYASCIRGGDSPYDENINFLRSIYPAAYVPVTHNDYLVWTNFEPDWHLATLLMKQLTTGVPNFTVDPIKMKKKHKAILKTWLDFFNEHKALYGPESNFKPQNASLTAFERSHQGTVLLSVVAPGKSCSLPDRVDRVILFNLSGEKQVFVTAGSNGTRRHHFEARYYDHLRHEILKVSSLEIVGHTLLEIPSPGYVELISLE